MDINNGRNVKRIKEKRRPTAIRTVDCIAAATVIKFGMYLIIIFIILINLLCIINKYEVG